MLPRAIWERTASTFAVLVISSFAVLSSSSVHAQVAGATLSGTVTDPSDAAVVGARVSITNKATHVTRDTETDSTGFYSAPNRCWAFTTSPSGLPGFRRRWSQTSHSP